MYQPKLPQLAFPPAATFPTDGCYWTTQPFLAWALNHYVYDSRHYTWVSRYLFPYRRPNPKSSNPLEILKDLYQPCVDNDPYDAFVVQKRLKLRAGVEAIVRADPSHDYHGEVGKLLHICDHIDVTFLWPIIYIVQKSVTTRGLAANSALQGSEEYLVRDLREHEFVIVFPDFDRQAPLSQDLPDFMGAFHTAPDPGLAAINQLYARS